MKGLFESGTVLILYYYSGIWSRVRSPHRENRSPLGGLAGVLLRRDYAYFCSWPWEHYCLLALNTLLGRAEFQYKASLRREARREITCVVQVLTAILEAQCCCDSCRAIRQNAVMEASESAPNTSPFTQNKKKKERCCLFYASLHFSMAGRNMREGTVISLLVNPPTSLKCPSGCCVWKIRNLMASQMIVLCTKTRELAMVNTLTT